MVALVTVIGGTGVFGRRIAEDIAAHTDAEVRIVGRDEASGRSLAESIGCQFRAADVNDHQQLLRTIDDSYIVIHTAGPFQECDYRVAKACIHIGSHYIDIADARRFVVDITQLNASARARNVFVTAGASSVPGVTSALCTAMRDAFQSVDSIQIALSPGNQNPRGASTIGAILSYLGRPIRLSNHGRWINRRGWGDVRRLEFPPPVGRRRVHNCDVPDLELFPELFDAKTVRFHAGVELDVINYALSTIAFVRRVAPMPTLPRFAPLFLHGSLMLFHHGTKNGSLAVWMRGLDQNGSSTERRMAIVTDDDGPATPSAAAIILANNLLKNGPPCVGAMPCLNMITVDELAAHLRRFGVWIVRGDESDWYARTVP